VAAVAALPQPRRADILHNHLAAAARGATGPEANVRSAVTMAFVAGLQTLKSLINALEDAIVEQLAVHPDAATFTSLPKAGTVRAARLIAEIGDCRSRFPTAQSLISLAGAAPSTRQSGKVTVVSFRYAVDKQLRGAVMDFAGDSHHANPWAADLYWRARRRGKCHSHATHPGPSLATRLMEMLAGPPALRPSQAPGLPNPDASRLTQGFSCRGSGDHLAAATSPLGPISQGSSGSPRPRCRDQDPAFGSRPARRSRPSPSTSVHTYST